MPAAPSAHTVLSPHDAMEIWAGTAGRSVQRWGEGEWGRPLPAGAGFHRVAWDGGSAEQRFRVVADTQAAVTAAVRRLRSIGLQADSLLAWAAEGGRDPAGLAGPHRAPLAALGDLEAELTSVERNDGPAGERTVAGLDRQYGSLLNHLNGTGG